MKVDGVLGTIVVVVEVGDRTVVVVVVVLVVVVATTQIDKGGAGLRVSIKEVQLRFVIALRTDVLVV